jgi:hypothetical protein
MTYKLSAVPADLIPVIWERVKHMIEEPISHSNNEICINNIYDRLVENDMIMVTITLNRKVIAVITMEKISPPGGVNILNLTTVGGTDMIEWMDNFSDVIDKIAYEQGCDEIYIVGRPAWQKILKPMGFNHIHTVMGRKVGV